LGIVLKEVIIEGNTAAIYLLDSGPVKQIYFRMSTFPVLGMAMVYHGCPSHMGPSDGTAMVESKSIMPPHIQAACKK
jgi:hypothetical protein